MDPLFDKPFEAKSGFISRLFKGFPAYYARPDLQQYYDSLEHNLHNHSKLLGGDITADFKILDTSGWNSSRTVYTLNLGILSDIVINTYKNEVTIPQEGFSHTSVHAFNGNDVNSDPSQEVTSFYLIADETTVTFSDNPTKAGISGPALTTPLESSDVLEFTNFSIGIAKGSTVPEIIAGKKVVVCLAQFTFIYDNIWNPVIIQNLRVPKTKLDNGSTRFFPFVSKPLSNFGILDFFTQAFDSLNSRALRKDGTNDATEDIYTSKSGGRYKIITQEDIATTTDPGVVKLSTEAEAKDPTNNVTALTPFGLFKAFSVRRKVIEIGVWNMDTTDTVIIPHGLSALEAAIAYPSAVYIIDDAGTFRHNILSEQGGGVLVNGSNVSITRQTGGLFDAPEYDNLPNRGFIVLELLIDATLPDVFEPTIVDAADVSVEIPSGQPSINTVLVGAVTSNGGTITLNSWSFISGPVSPNLSSNGDSVSIDFTQAGTYVFRHTVTASNGVSSSTGFQETTVTVTEETLIAPIVNITFNDGTTAPKSFIGASSLIPMISNIITSSVGGVTVDVVEWEERSPSTGLNFANVKTVNQVNTSNTDHTDSAGASGSGLYEYRMRVRDSQGLYSNYSNVLTFNFTLQTITRLFSSTSNYVTNNISYAAGSLGFKTRGTYGAGILSFNLRAHAEEHWIEYDPNNVQTLPNPRTLYLTTSLISITLSRSLDMTLFTDRQELQQLLRVALLTHPRNLLCIIGNIDYIGYDSSYIIRFSTRFERGSVDPNQDTNTFDVPNLAKRIRFSTGINNINYV